MKDQMKMGDELVKASLKCAVCGKDVEKDKQHQCEKENKDEESPN